MMRARPSNIDYRSPAFALSNARSCAAVLLHVPIQCSAFRDAAMTAIKGRRALGFKQREPRNTRADWRVAGAAAGAVRSRAPFAQPNTHPNHAQCYLQQCAESANSRDFLSTVVQQKESWDVFKKRASATTTAHPERGAARPAARAFFVVLFVVRGVCKVEWSGGAGGSRSQEDGDGGEGGGKTERLRLAPTPSRTPPAAYSHFLAVSSARSTTRWL